MSKPSQRRVGSETQERRAFDKVSGVTVGCNPFRVEIQLRLNTQGRPQERANPGLNYATPLGWAAKMSNLQALSLLKEGRGLEFGHFRRHVNCPGGTFENSPTFQRWAMIRFNIVPVPKGRLNFCGSHVVGINLSRPFGTYYFSDAEPNVETLGYYRRSLRDMDMSLRDSKNVQSRALSLLKEGRGRRPRCAGRSPTESQSARTASSPSPRPQRGEGRGEESIQHLYA